MFKILRMQSLRPDRYDRGWWQSVMDKAINDAEAYAEATVDENGKALALCELMREGRDGGPINLNKVDLMDPTDRGIADQGAPEGKSDNDTKV